MANLVAAAPDDDDARSSRTNLATMAPLLRGMGSQGEEPRPQAPTPPSGGASYSPGDELPGEEEGCAAWNPTSGEGGGQRVTGRRE